MNFRAVFHSRAMTGKRVPANNIFIVFASTSGSLSCAAKGRWRQQREPRNDMWRLADASTHYAAPPSPVSL